MRGHRGPAGKRPHRRPGGRRLTRDAAAVTPLVGTILILGIAVAGLAIVMTWGLPALQQTQADAELTGIIHQFENLEELAENVMRSGGIGKANEATLAFTEGQLQKVDGTLFVVALHPQNPGYDESHRYWLEVTDTGDPYAFLVREGSATTSPGGTYIVADEVTSDRQAQRATGQFDATGEYTFSVARDQLANGTLRVRVMTPDNPDDVVLMEAWVLPSGALHYERHAPFGEVSVLLEAGSVITTYETGSHIHTQPLVRLENRTVTEAPNPDVPSFLGLFAQLYRDDPAQAGIQSAGPGGHPIRLSLQENVLRVGGTRALDLSVQAFGARGALWQEYFQEQYGFAPAADWEDEYEARYGFPTAASYADGVGTVLAAGLDYDSDCGDPLDPACWETTAFEFVLMESRIELSLLEAGIRLDA